MKRIVLLWALACGFFPAAQAQNGVTADLIAAQKELLPDEDMQLKVRVENRSGQDIVLGKDSDWIRFAVTGENDLPVTQLGEMAAAGEFSLQSAQAGTVKFNLTPCFDFRKPGRYTVKATIKIPQWSEEISCRPAAFTVITGVRLANLPDLQVGLPPAPGATNQAPEVRRYFLQKVSLESGLKLYFQLTDATGARTLRAFPIGPMTSFSDPEVQIDKFSNLHVLHQTGAQSFNYSVINALGQLLDRQTYEYTGTRPTLRSDNAGGVMVSGGVRRISSTDIPPPEKADDGRSKLSGVVDGVIKGAEGVLKSAVK